MSIVENIITISALETKQEKIKMSQTHINAIIVRQFEIFEKFADEKNLQITYHLGLSDKNSVVYTDKTKLTQILTNLIGNALKFTDKGFIEFGYKLTGDFLEFYVKDTGIGVEPAMLDRIFERFIQAETGLVRKYGGSGLGLSISKGFVELMGGTMRVESQLGQGTTFFFTIPYNQTENG
jgi:signal transduction histidine kinase